MSLSPDIQARIVKISLPASGGDEHWHFTGFVLCDGLVITCRHGFVKKKCFDDERPIKIVCQKGEGGGGTDEKVSFSGQRIDQVTVTELGEVGKPILYESEAFDVALLSCPNLKAIYHPVRPLAGNGEWFSGGFPKFNREGEANGFKLFAGRQSGRKIEVCYQSMTVFDPLLDSDDDWKNASGSPVFVDDQFIGLLKEYRKEAKGNFVVSDLQKLWDQNDNFRKTIESFCPELIFNFHQKQLKTLIEKLNVLEVKAKDILKKGFPEIVEAFRQVEPVHRDDQFDKALLSALSAKYEQSPRFLSVPETDHPFFTVPVARTSTSELLMAAESQRDPRFIKKSEPNQSGKIIHRVVPDTKLHLACPPEFGIEGHKAEDVMKALLEGSADERYVVARLFGDYDADKIRSYDPIDMKRIAEKRLEREKGRYYWPVRTSERNREAIMKVHRALPLLKILDLNDDLDLEEEEQELFKELAKFMKD